MEDLCRDGRSLIILSLFFPSAEILRAEAARQENGEYLSTRLEKEDCICSSCTKACLSLASIERQMISKWMTLLHQILVSL